MYKLFHDIESLCRYTEEDKHAKGVDAANLDRYPIRFVLFDNFKDSLEYVEWLQQERYVHIESVGKWIDSSYPDLIITHNELADRITEHIKTSSPHDRALAPFSELARFYDNQETKAFDALIKTIKGIQASIQGIEHHQRVYIPIVGLEGKMETFKEDSQIYIWRMIAKNRDVNYRLIVTENTDYGVKGLVENYTVVNNIGEWLNLWKNTQLIAKPQIICKSKSIFANVDYAQPDNAFSYEICHSAYDFLKNGLSLSFGGIRQHNDEENWEKLASMIDISNGFSFDKYVRDFFEVNEIGDYRDFIRLWFQRPTIFERWLLARYFVNKEGDNGYLCRVINATSNYGTNELIENLSITLPDYEADIVMRRHCMNVAARNYVVLSASTENLLSKKLIALPEKIGYFSALKCFTNLSRKEKDIAINWIGHGNITYDGIKSFFPDLYTYLKDGISISANIPNWVDSYFADYKQAKISNKYTSEIAKQINTLNASEVTFDKWYNQFSTTYTLLQNRGDIEVFYWIDGLGVDWIPLVKKIVTERKEQQIYLNEVLIARSILPTKTENNKADLKRLQPEKELEKSGNIDALAHNTDNVSPFSICTEITMVRKSIEDVLNRYIGKKIAIVSDHGLTYLSQLQPGKNMAGVDSDHHGRVAVCHKLADISDTSYIRLSDGKTLCALKHESLCAKVPTGQGCHGGCTPEEVLVPIFIISSSPASTNWSADLLTEEISASNPHVRFTIKNAPSIEVPYIEYNHKEYSLHFVGNDTYESERLTLDSNETTVSLVVGDIIRNFFITIQTGVEENNLFDW